MWHDNLFQIPAYTVAYVLQLGYLVFGGVDLLQRLVLLVQSVPPGGTQIIDTILSLRQLCLSLIQRPLLSIHDSLELCTLVPEDVFLVDAVSK